MNSDIILWLNSNEQAIVELIKPLLKQKEEAVNTYDNLFHDEIINQFESLALSIIGIEVCKSLGCSVEDYYETIQDEIVYNYITNKIFEGEQNDQD